MFDVLFAVVVVVAVVADDDEKEDIFLAGFEAIFIPVGLELKPYRKNSDVASFCLATWVVPCS